MTKDMKKILNIFVILATLVSLASCAKWLDVNTDPDNPNNESATCENRLPWIQYYYGYAWGTENTRGSAIAQMVTNTSRTAALGLQANWNPAQGIATTVYQNWFLGAASNIGDLITKSKETESTHYEAAALVMKAMGFIMMADLYGEMPYLEAVGADFTPPYDNGDVIYKGCLEDLDKAIELFSAPQGSAGIPLSAGDLWCGGDPNKWIKLAYGLKARWLNNMSKMAGFDPQAVLDALAKGPQSTADNILMHHQNVETAGTCFTVGDAYGPNVTYDSFAWGTGQRMTRYYVDLLTNFKGSGVEDPRADKLLPSAMYKVTLKEDGTIKSYEWLRDAGVNAYTADDGWITNRLVGGNLNAYLAPVLVNGDKECYYKEADILKYYESVEAFEEVFDKYYLDSQVTITEYSKGSYTPKKSFDPSKVDADAKPVDDNVVAVVYHPGAMFVQDNNPLYVEDIKYVQVRSDGIFETAGLAANDMNCYYSGNSTFTRASGLVQGTGAFYTRITSDSYIMTYTEMCFIKAEVLFNKGDKAGAHAAYIEGIKSHFQLMNAKLTSWMADGCGTTARGFDVSFAYAPIPQDDIDAYMASKAVVQSAGDLTLSDIMMQKYIAQGPDYQKYNDVRKYNYYMPNAKYGNEVVYTGMMDPAFRTGSSSAFEPDKANRRHFVRRWQHSSHETNYNNTEVTKSYAQYGLDSPLDDTIWTIPVFWDVD